MCPQTPPPTVPPSTPSGPLPTLPHLPTGLSLPPAAGSRSDFSDWLRAQLVQAGMAARELGAQLASATPELLDAMPPPVLAEMSAGRVPTRGFGLGGSASGGKTMALAALVRESVSRGLQERATLPARITSLEWVAWLEEAAWMRSHAMSGECWDRVERLAHVPLLVLDDLGRERIKGSYAEDWAVSQLEVVINKRNRAGRPILWTCNLPMAELLATYGPSLVRRLCEDNPYLWVEKLPVRSAN